MQSSFETDADSLEKRANPFATRFIKPDAAEYLFPPEYSAASLLEKLAANQYWGEIIAPHGSGKSTLLATLTKQLQAMGRNVDRYTLTSEKDAPGWTKKQIQTWSSNTQVIVDGYEQLSWWNSMRLQRLVKQAQAGLLVTAHQRGSFPLLVDLTPNLSMAQTIVKHLLQDDQRLITSADVTQAYESNKGNLREMLFRLYDIYEVRTRLISND